MFKSFQNFLIPEIPKMCDPILVTVLKMQPHYSQSSRENATPSSGTSPVASYKEVSTPRDCYPVDKLNKTNHAFQWIVTYTVTALATFRTAWA